MHSFALFRELLHNVVILNEESIDFFKRTTIGLESPEAEMSANLSDTSIVPIDTDLWIECPYDD